MEVNGMSEKVVRPPIAVVPCSGPCYDFTADGERRERATVFIAPIAIRPKDSENIYVSWGCNRGIFCFDRECRYAQTKGGQRRGEGEIDRRVIEPFGNYGEEH
jgi:hypothetical protein